MVDPVRNIRMAPPAKNKSVQRQEVGSCCPVVEDYYVDDTVGP